MDVQTEPDNQDVEMSRGTMTTIICLFIALTAFIGVGVLKMGQDPDYPGCELGFMGAEDEDCRSDAAVRHLMMMR